MLVEIQKRFEAEQYNEVLRIWTNNRFIPEEPDDRINLFQMLAISAEYEQNRGLAYDISKKALQLLINEPISEENQGLKKMFGRIGVNSLKSTGQLVSTYKFINKYNLNEVDHHFSDIQNQIKEPVYNKIFTYFGLIYLVIILTLIFLNRNLLLFDPLLSIIMDFCIVVISIILVLVRKSVSKVLLNRPFV